MTGFGPHLTLDGYGCNREKLEDLDLIYSILDEFPSYIGMTKIMPPYVFRYTGLKPEDWGVSGFVLIAESHISIHTFPCKNYLSLDIFSCKNFDAEKAVSYIREIFEIKKYQMNLFDRGAEFPKDIEKSAKIVAGQRKKITPLIDFQKENEAKLSRRKKLLA
ncbi:MAG: S-adenosylmethionine decarboxylase proenzyme [Candidatus Schekmanbacteria bacterium RBG_16_38_11]|uniref:S-adenosylmethionine decarboxylase proenzyme n=1 Tax=Candidatus Schekmanbacteria bacterium RBG_16_38_11 TaxID=1817880 RepID=A0A1F7RRY0_9BACT|nr:MAG: S-adenosylmethionine decarboxylase proenzyme [Candidatus Schekmanbacteria bacterium RBG_16_38_11]